MQARSSSGQRTPGTAAARTAAAPTAPALTTPAFFNLAGQERLLSRLVDLFQTTIAAEHAEAHHCSRLVLGFHMVPLFGTASGHAARIAKRIEAEPLLAEQPGVVEARGARNALMTFPVQFPTGDPLIVSLAFDRETIAGIDRQQRARLNGLATIYAMKALPLWEIEEDIETASPLTLKERVTLAMILSGAAHFEVAERLSCSMRAISGHIRNAIEKLEAADETNAIALAARRGWLHLPHEFGITHKTLDH